mmetsp:Transcript_73603/g.170704  ORF Transcript_73603/g.170704 Transcript_73603/m.170704 type:complete len:228 (-) Transcript_73603:140-823(-)
MGLVRCSAKTRYEVTFYCPPQQPAAASLAHRTTSIPLVAQSTQPVRSSWSTSTASLTTVPGKNPWSPSTPVPAWIPSSVEPARSTWSPPGVAWSPSTVGPARAGWGDTWHPSTNAPAAAVWDPQLAGATWSPWSPTTAKSSWGSGATGPTGIVESPTIVWSRQPFFAFRKFEAGHLPVAVPVPSVAGMVVFVAIAVALVAALAMVARARASPRHSELPEVEELLAAA